MSNMYSGARTWNVFKGCWFNCSYCRPSFQAQAKRQKKNCPACYAYTPHLHLERMEKIPSSDLVFACANGDIAYCPRWVIVAMLHQASKRPAQTFYFQTKRPSHLQGLSIPDNVILVTTLETDIDDGYRKYVSRKAPLPTERYFQFLELEHPRKVVTVEPIMEFDEKWFPWRLKAIGPECVWIGYNSRPKSVQLPEPELSKTLALIKDLESAGIPVRRKTMRERWEAK